MCGANSTINPQRVVCERESLDGMLIPTDSE